MYTQNFALAILAALSLVATSVSGSAIKGHSQQQQQQQQQAAPIAKAEVAAVKGAEKAPVGRSQAAPILESSKKIYNDESLRRLPTNIISGSVDQAPVAKNAPIAKVPEAAVIEPAIVKFEHIAPVVKPVVPVMPQYQPSAVVVSGQEPVVEVAPKQVEKAVPVAAPVETPSIVTKEIVQVPFVAAAPIQPVIAKAAEELPSQSERSAPVKEQAVVQEQKQAAPIVEQPFVVDKKEEQQNFGPIITPIVAGQQAPVAQALVSEPEAPVAQALVSEPEAPIQAPAPAVPIQAPVPAVPSQEPVPIPSIVVDSSLAGKKDEAVDSLHIETPEPDPQLVLSQPIDSTTKLLIDLDEHVQKFLPAEDKQADEKAHRDSGLVAGIDYSPPAAEQQQQHQPTGKSSVGSLQPYSSSGAVVVDEPIVPPLPASIEGVEKASSAAAAAAAGSAAAAAAAVPASSSSSSSSAPSASRQAGNQNGQSQQQVITQLLDQLDALQNRIQDTINQLVARRRYVMSALLRPMGTYVRRVRTNLERLQTRVNQLQAAAQSVGNGQNRPGGFVDAAAIETIRRRIDDISKRISDIVNRIRFSLTPTSAPLNQGRRK